ncbi:MAG: hypothetical protein ACLQI7_03420 [Streptosporangiaceae bacterium]
MNCPARSRAGTDWGLAQIDLAREDYQAAFPGWWSHSRSTATCSTRRDRRRGPQRYFTDAPFVGGAKTCVLTKMWGRGTEPTLTGLRDAFTETRVSFRAED